MTDADLLAKWKTITDPVEALGELVEHSAFLGSDPYYRDLAAGLMDMAERVFNLHSTKTAPDALIEHQDLLCFDPRLRKMGDALMDTVDRNYRACGLPKPFRPDPP